MNSGYCRCHGRGFGTIWTGLRRIAAELRGPRLREALPYEWKQLPQETVQKFSMFSFANHPGRQVIMFPQETAAVEKPNESDEDRSNIENHVLTERQMTRRVHGREDCIRLEICVR
jgi:hypothetical protein